MKQICIFSYLIVFRAGQWKRFLRENKIFKNLNKQEVLRIKQEIPPSLETWKWLIFASDVLVENEKVEETYKRMKGTRKISNKVRRDVFTLPLCFSFIALRDPNVFRTFQRLLFHTRVHFDHCFDTGIWAPDERGLYARNEELKFSLIQLSNLHNVVVDALRQIRDGDIERGRALIQGTSPLHMSIVKTNHHRQFSDILAIFLLLHRRSQFGIMREMQQGFHFLARGNLLHNDPRIAMFASLVDENLPLDSTGHLYLAYDAYCRHLWFTRVGQALAKDFFSYNQASFPRADPGEFYQCFRGKHLELIKLDLTEVDSDLGEESHESFIIWHTTVRSLGNEGRPDEMLRIIKVLCQRVDRLGREFDYHQWRQLNVDSSLSYYLLGDAYERQGDLQNARVAFYEACRLRDLIIPAERYDSPRISALIKLQSIIKRLEASSMTTFLCKQLLEGMYSTIK